MNRLYYLVYFFLPSILLSQNTIERSTTFSNLPFSENELRFLSESTDATIILRPGNKKERILSDIEKYDIIHFATHTFIDNDNPLNSRFIVFNSEQTDFEDQAMFVSDIMPLNLKAKLAVLTSCNTGVGKLARGEGILSIARSFRYAGCPSVIMSLWELDDISTSKIISGFYENLKDGLDKDEALREAKLNYLKEANSKNSSPLYWAGIISSGSQTGLTFENEINYKSIFIVIVIALLVLFAVRKKLTAKRGNA